MTLKTIVLYSPDPWDSAMPILRVRSPARLAGITVLQGNHGDQIDPGLVSKADVVIIQRDFPRFPDYSTVITRARDENKFVVYEVDDMIMEVPHDHVLRTAFISVLSQILRGIIEADAVVTSTAVLRDYFSNFNPNVWLIPNLLDDAIWNLKSPHPVGDPEKAVVIGYMGGGSHLPDLEMVKPVLLRLLEDYGSRIGLRFWGVQPPAELIEHPRVEWYPLNILDYAEFANYFGRQECDIFIAPLLDNFFNRCKSQIKFLEYSALGVAGIYSSLEPYTTIVINGENGLLAATPKDWETCLRQLIDTPDMRNRLAINAQESLRRDWLLSTKYHEWLETYERGMIPPERMTYRRSSLNQSILRITDQIEEYQQSLQLQLANLAGLVGEKERESMVNDQRAIAAETKLGEMGQELINIQQRLADREEYLAKREEYLAEVIDRLNERDNQLAEIMARLSEMEQQVATTLEKLSEKESLLIESEKQITELTNTLNFTKEQLNELEQRLNDTVHSLTIQIQARDIQIEQIYQSTTWRIGSKLAKGFRYIFPQKTDRAS